MARGGGFLSMLIGGLEIAGGAALTLVPGGAALSPFLISAGAGQLLSGLGTVIAGMRTIQGGTATRNPIKPWDVQVGHGRVPGTLVYVNQWPSTGPGGIIGVFAPNANVDIVIDLVFVLTSNPIQCVDRMMFDNNKVPIDPTKIFWQDGPGPGRITPALGGTSYNPTQTNMQSGHITSVARLNGVLTVVLPFDIPALDVGDPIIVQDGNGGTVLTTAHMNGTFTVSQILSRVANTSLTFTVLNGGPDLTISSGLSNAFIQTQWHSYGANVYVEYMTGTQALGETFNGQIGGTPYRGGMATYGPNIAGQYTTGNDSQPWTNYCSIQGKSLAFVRMYYDSTYFTGGLPQFSWLIHGKDNIYDPRLGAATGLKKVTLSSPGSGGYRFWDVLTLTTGGSGGQVKITGVDASGNPTSWILISTGHGYSLGTSATSGGTGSGATFDVMVLGGIASGVAGVSISDTGTGYKIGECLQLDSGSLGAVKITSTGSGGSVTGIAIVYAGYGYNIGVTTTNNNFGGSNGGYGCTINITALTNGNTPSSAIYSENAALVTADFLADTIWGYSAQYVLESSTNSPYNAIGITALTTSANVCDQQQTLADASSPAITIGPYSWPQGTEPLWACNGRFDLSMHRGEILQNLLTSCAGRLLYVGGLYSIQPAYWVPAGFSSVPGPSVPAVSSALVNLTSIASGPFHWKPTVGIRDLYNAVKGTYISQANKWQPSDFPYYAQDSLHGYSGPPQYGGDINLAVDLGQRRYKDIHLPFTLSSRQAQQTAKVELLRTRNEGANGIGTGTFALTMAGYQFVPLDVIEATATAPFLSWSNKLLEVTAVRLRADKQGGGPGGSGGGGAVVLSTEVDAQETSAATYVWSIDEELTPQGYQQALPPTATAKEVVCFPWSPGGAAPLDGDALYLAGTAGLGNFDILPIYAADAQGIATANLQITGAPPINQLDGTIGPPYVTAVSSDTGGSLAPGTYAIGVSAFDGSGNNTPYLDLAIATVHSGQGAASVSLVVGGSGFHLNQNVVLQGGDNNCVVAITGVSATGTVTSIDTTPVNAGSGYTTGNYPVLVGGGLSINIGTLTAATSTGSIAVRIEWGSGDDGGDLYMALQPNNPAQYALLTQNSQQLAQNQMHYQQTLSPGQTTTAITSFDASTSGGPDTLFDHLGIVWQKVVHTGPWAEQIQAVTGTSGTSPGKITIFGTGMTTNQWAGYTLTLLAHYDPTVPIQILNMPIASSTASSGGIFTLTIGRNSVSGQLPSLTSLLSVADLVTVRYNPTFTASSFTDPNIANGFYPTGDLATEAGHLAVVMTGVDAGDVQTVASVSGASNDTINIAGTWQITPNTGDIVIIVEPASVPEWTSKPFHTPNKSGGAIVVGTPAVQNLLEQVWLFTVKTEDVHGNSAPLFVAPSREYYFFGGQGTRLINYTVATGGVWSMNTWDGSIDADCTAGNVVYNCLPGAFTPNQEFTVSVQAISGSNTVTVNAYPGGTIGGVVYPADTFGDGTTTWVGSVLGASRTWKVSA